MKHVNPFSSRVAGNALYPPAVLFALVAITGCILQDKDETVREYPIAAGRYYPASALDGVPRDSALRYTDFSADGTSFRDVLKSRTDCAISLVEGSWVVHADVDDGERRLRKNPLRGAGGSDLSGPCQTEDSLGAVRADWSESFWLRGVTDTTFQLCDDVNEICFAKCAEKSGSPSNACYGYDSARTTDSYWETWTK